GRSAQHRRRSRRTGPADRRIRPSNRRRSDRADGAARQRPGRPPRMTILNWALLHTLPFLFVLTLVVTVHELGHFLVARWLGVAVDRFSINFGRPLLKWIDRAGIEWRIGWIPLGGYVRFAGDAEASSSVPDEEALAEMRAQIRQR